MPLSGIESPKDDLRPGMVGGGSGWDGVRFQDTWSGRPLARKVSKHVFGHNSGPKASKKASGAEP